MAETDAAGSSPNGTPDHRRKASRPLSIAAAIRQMERQTAPLRAEMERAAKFGRQIEASAAPIRRMLAEFGLEEEAEPSALPTPPRAVPVPKPPPEPARRPVFEVAPGPNLLAALREAFPGFKPTDRWWSFVEMELKTAHHRSHPEAHDTFCAAYAGWSTEDLLRHLEAEGLSKKPPRQRGETTCERLRDLHEKDPDFAETASLRKVGKQIGRSTGAIDGSHYYQTKLKPIRETIMAEKARVKAARRFGHFDSVGRRDESTEGL